MVISNFILNLCFFMTNFKTEFWNHSNAASGEASKGSEGNCHKILNGTLLRTNTTQKIS